MHFFAVMTSALTILFAVIQGPMLASASCFRARDVAGGVETLETEALGRRSFIHCGKHKHHDDDDDDYYHKDDDKDY